MSDDSDVVPDNDLPDESGDVAQASAPDESNQQVPDNDLPDQYGEEAEGSAPQEQGILPTLMAGEEGLERQITGGLSDVWRTKVEPHILPESMQTTAQDIQEREQEHPVASQAGEITGGLISSAALPESEGLGLVGSMALKGFLGGALFTGSDEVSKLALGEGDPQAPVASALINTGIGGLFGAGLGAGLGLVGLGASSGLKAIANTQMGNNARQFLSDLGNRMDFLKLNPSVQDAVTNELSSLYNSNEGMVDETYGTRGLKNEVIAKLVPEMNDGIQNQVQSLGQKISNTVDNMRTQTTRYPGYLVDRLQRAVDNFNSGTFSQDSSQVYSAIQDFKQQLQGFAKYGKSIKPIDPGFDFVQDIKPLASDIRGALEDQNVWGDAGKVQAGVNQAYTKFVEPHSWFTGKFTTADVNGNQVIDPGKVNGFVNAIGKARGALRQSGLEEYINASQAFRNQVDNLYSQVGINSPFEPASLNATTSTFLGKQTPGSQFADRLYHGVFSPAFERYTERYGTALGAWEGYRENGIMGALKGGAIGFAAPYLLEGGINAASKYAIPIALKVLSAEAPYAMGDAIEHANNIGKGAQMLTTGVNSLFDNSTRTGISAVASNKADKIRKYVENRGLDKEIENQNKYDIKAGNLQKPQGFAEGGMVKAPEALKNKSKSMGHFEKALPEQALLMNQAKARVYGYLSSLSQTKNVSPLPFDFNHEDQEKKRHYEKALKFAANPIEILNHIKDGSLTPEDMAHFKSLWPEVHDHMSKKIMERVSQAQIDNEKPKFHVRQAMSLFLGSPIESSFTPQAILAAQQTFSQGQQSAQAPQGSIKQAKPKGEKSKLNKADAQYRTLSDATISRQQTAR